jgi:2-keto-4-pentenoate hydratase
LPNPPLRAILHAKRRNVVAIDLETAVSDFWAARQRGEWFPSAYAGRLGLDDAYRIQLELIDRRVAEGERHVGWKVGLTAKVIQEQFGFHEPVFGCILETQPSGHVFGANELITPGFETEICMRLGRDFDGPATIGEVRNGVAEIHPSFEVIETRGDFVNHIALALADNAQQRSVILGAGRPLGNTRLEEVEAQVLLNGKEVARGPGSAVLGNPLESVAWLAGKLGAYGRRLRAGDVVMTGSFVRQFPLAPGDEARAVFSGIGEVTLLIAPN